MEPQGTSTANTNARRWRTLEEAKSRFERRYLIAALTKASGCVKRAAILAGRDRSHFHELVKKHGLTPKDYRNVRRRSRTRSVAVLPERPREWFGVPLSQSRTAVSEPARPLVSR